jgi:hypothetical protein
MKRERGSSGSQVALTERTAMRLGILLLLGSLGTHQPSGLGNAPVLRPPSPSIRPTWFGTRRGGQFARRRTIPGLRTKRRCFAVPDRPIAKLQMLDDRP